MEAPRSGGVATALTLGSRVTTHGCHVPQQTFKTHACSTDFLLWKVMPQGFSCGPPPPVCSSLPSTAHHLWAGRAGWALYGGAGGMETGLVAKPLPPNGLSGPGEQAGKKALNGL
uniref:Uncharacterized protein n=1 Tax=Knipowitschia caucasica TaxID=637954 RepID=A0AAV2L6F1_KNICA